MNEQPDLVDVETLLNEIGELGTTNDTILAKAVKFFEDWGTRLEAMLKGKGSPDDDDDTADPPKPAADGGGDGGGDGEDDPDNTDKPEGDDTDDGGGNSGHEDMRMSNDVDATELVLELRTALTNFTGEMAALRKAIQGDEADGGSGGLAGEITALRKAVEENAISGESIQALQKGVADVKETLLKQPAVSDSPGRAQTRAIMGRHLTEGLNADGALTKVQLVKGRNMGLIDETAQRLYKQHGILSIDDAENTRLVAKLREFEA